MTTHTRIGGHICSDCHERVTHADHATVDKRLKLALRGIGFQIVRVRHTDCARGLRRTE